MPAFSFSKRVIIIMMTINIRTYKKQHPLELLVEVEGVDEEEGAAEGDLCGGSCTRSLLNNIIGWRVVIRGVDTIQWGNEWKGV